MYSDILPLMYSDLLALTYFLFHTTTDILPDAPPRDTDRLPKAPFGIAMSKGKRLIYYLNNISVITDDTAVITRAGAHP